MITSGSEDHYKRELRRPFWKLRFTPPLEAEFIAAAADRRLKHNMICVAALIVLYDIALIPDWLQSPETFAANAVLRLTIFTPFCLVCLAILKRGAPPLLQEILLGLILVMTVLFETSRLVQSDFDADAAIYQLGGGLCCMMFAAVVMKARFSTTLVVLLLMFVLKANFIWVAPGSIGAAGRAIMMHAFASAVMMLLLAAFLLERAERVGFIQGLRASLLNRELEKAASTDGLTGLGNRRYLSEVTNSLWTDQEGPNLVSVVLIDIDHFKLFNDHYGHVGGDVCLRRVSECVKAAATRPDQMAFRYGGEELLLVLPDTVEADARVCAERVRELLSHEAIPHLGLNSDALVTISIGIATADRRATSLTDLIATADNALYNAKRAGRDRVWPPRRETVENGSEALPAKPQISSKPRTVKTGTR
ncbi:GGDEF domain-containing protein [Rhizobium sp. 18065]|uniref:GGDEF domain-containing protein n=1 Tax=Rhizobium sp. 18065 TaxID=2681411 RepID=UPI00135C8D3D|nr:GGDEF domain-containing protein [Rhizobium sp. 18065]